MDKLYTTIDRSEYRELRSVCGGLDFLERDIPHGREVTFFSTPDRTAAFYMYAGSVSGLVRKTGNLDGEGCKVDVVAWMTEVCRVATVNTVRLDCYEVRRNPGRNLVDLYNVNGWVEEDRDHFDPRQCDRSLHDVIVTFAGYGHDFSQGLPDVVYMVLQRS